MNNETAAFLRYPGGKQRLLKQLLQHLQPLILSRGRFVEPFVGGGAVFFALCPERAVLTDINGELIDLYRGIRDRYTLVWKAYCAFPNTRDGYYQVRDADNSSLSVAERAARTLYLNRTCFKGMWRHNSQGKFNVGYGGEARRGVIDRPALREASYALRQARLRKSDFERVIDRCTADDVIFCDPPYSPGERDMLCDHYVCSKFLFADHQRLAKALHHATSRNVRWAMTTSSHPDILALFPDAVIIPLSIGVGRRPGELTTNCGEVLICNYGK
jgi:DNA adenine methylase